MCSGRLVGFAREMPMQEPPRKWMRLVSSIVSGVTCETSPVMSHWKPSWSPTTSTSERQARMVAAPMTLLMPGAGPPATTMASLLLGELSELSDNGPDLVESLSRAARSRSPGAIARIVARRRPCRPQEGVGSRQPMHRAPGCSNDRAGARGDERRAACSPVARAIDVPGAIAHFREHGWARLGSVASPATLARLRARADDIMMGRVTHEGLFFQRDSQTGRYEELVFGRGWEGPSLEYRKIEKLEVDPYFRAWLENEVFERVARGVLGDAVALYRATLFTKSARGGTVLPWHQDGGSFWGLDRDPELQIWTALDDAPPESGCVEVVDASHLRGPRDAPRGDDPSRSPGERCADERATPLPGARG